MAPQATDRRRSTLQKRLTAVHGIALLVGAVVGSGIFVSPKGVTRNVKSVGLSLIIWVFCGFHHMCLALCYGELGTMNPKAGGDYFYAHDGLGSLPGFLILWVNTVAIAPANVAVLARTAGDYIMAVMFPNCGSPLLLVMLLALWISIAFTIINCVSVDYAAKIQTLLTACKLIALLFIIILGIIQLASGNVKNFQNAFEGSDWSPGALALGVFGGVFSVAGWEQGATIAEEMKNPVRDLPISIIAGMSIVVFVYVFANVAYFTVLTPQQLLDSPAVALTFGQKIIGPAAVIMSISVFLSCAGSVNGCFMAHPRITFAGAREKQTPRVFSFIHHQFMTPMPAIILLTVLGCAYTLIPDVFALMDYLVINSMFRWFLSLTTLLYLRWKKPDDYRPLKVPLPVVIINYIIVITLVILGIIQDPIVNGIGTGLFLIGIPLFFLGNLCLGKSGGHHTCIDKVTTFFQLLMGIVPEEGKDD